MSDRNEENDCLDNINLNNKKKSIWDRSTFSSIIHDIINSSYHKGFIHGMFLGVSVVGVSVLAYRLK